MYPHSNRPLLQGHRHGNMAKIKKKRKSELKRMKKGVKAWGNIKENIWIYYVTS